MIFLGIVLTLLFQVPKFTSFEIVGTVRDVQGKNVSNVRVSVVDENFQPLYTAFVDSTGRFNVKGVATGKYMFRIETTGTVYEEQQSGWVELSSLRRSGGATEVYPIDFVLSFKKGEGPRANGNPVFAQEVPKPALKEFEKATKELKNGKVDQALPALKKAIELFPDYYEALEQLGIEYVKAGKYDQAIPLLTHAIILNKRSARCMYGLGVAYLKLSRIQEALDWLEKSAQLDANNANTQMMLGLAYGAGGAFAKSEAALKKALQIGGIAAAEAHFYLAGLYNKLERYSEAWQALDTFLNVSKNVKDPAQIKAMIESLKLKESLKSTVAALPSSTAKPSVAGAIVETPTTDVPGTSSAALPSSTPSITPVPPLAAEYVELIKTSEKNGGEMYRKMSDFTYLLKKTKRTLNEHGKAGSTNEQIFEAYPIRGEHVLIKISTNGIPSKLVADARKHAVKELEEAEHKKETNSNSGTEGYLAAGISGVFHGKPSYVSVDISAILKTCEFFAPRIEIIANRPTIALNFRPQPGMALADKHAYIARIVGTVWIDQEDKIVTKLEAWPASKAAFNLIQETAPQSEAALIYKQERQPNGLWFPSLIRLNADGNFDLFDGLNWEVIFEFSKYQRFNTSANDLIVQPAAKKP